jgi:hypothetical protein
METFRKQNGKNGINMQSLQLYIGSSPAFLGVNNSMRFKDASGKSLVTSSYVFEYDKLAVPLERSRPDEEEPERTEVSGVLMGSHKVKKIAGKTTLLYTLKHTETYKEGDLDVENDLITYIYDSNLQHVNLLVPGHKYIVTGVLRLTKWTNAGGTENVRRTMEANSLQLSEQELNSDPPAEEPPF